MTESGTHKFIKQKIADALSELGYDTKTEHTVNEGRLDVYAKKGNNEIFVEVYKTHIPEWIIAKVRGDITEKEALPELSKSLPEISETCIRETKPSPRSFGIFYKGFALGSIKHDGTIFCFLCMIENLGGMISYTETKFFEHIEKDHTPINRETWYQLKWREENNEITN